MKTSALCLVLCFLFASSAFALDKNKDCKCRITSAKRIVGGEFDEINDSLKESLFHLNELRQVNSL